MIIKLIKILINNLKYNNLNCRDSQKSIVDSSYKSVFFRKYYFHF